MSWVRQWWEFCGGALILIGARDARKSRNPEHSPASVRRTGIALSCGRFIKRGNETLIPRGDDVVKLHDIVYFTTTRKFVPYIRKIAGKEDYADVRNVMIMGGSPHCRTYRTICPRLYAGENRDNDLNRL